MSSRPLFKRLTAGVSGQAYVRIANALSTIVLVPILIGAWGLNGYGEWIALTALAAYFSFSQFGLVTTTSYEIVMAISAHDKDRAKRAFQMSINITVYIVLPIIIFFMTIIWFLPISSILHLSDIERFGALAILSFAASQLFIATIRGILVAVLYATGSYALAYFVTGTMKLVELSAVVTLVFFIAAKQVSVAAVITSVALVDFAIIFAFARHAASWARFDMFLFDLKWVKTQIKPAAGFTMSNFSTQGIIVQGPRVLLSIIAGPQAVAVYAVYATAMRLVDQFMLMIALPLEIEIARCIGKNDNAKAYSLIVFGTQIGWFIFGIISIGFIISGNLIFELLSHGHISFKLSIMALFLVMSACNQIGRINAHALIATNRMYGPSVVTLAGCSVGLLCGGILANSYGLHGMAAGIIAAELFYSIVVIRANMRWMDKRIFAFICDVGNIHQAIKALSRSIANAFAGKRLT